MRLQRKLCNGWGNQMKWKVVIDTTLVFTCEVEAADAELACNQARLRLANMLVDAGFGSCRVDMEIAECEEQTK